MDSTASFSPENADFQFTELLSELNSTADQPVPALGSFDTENTFGLDDDTATSPDIVSERNLSVRINASRDPTMRSSTAVQRRIGSSTSEPQASDFGVADTPSAIEVPLRSIFTSPQPTSSVSANTAHASMSTTISRGLGVLSNSTGSRRLSSRPNETAIPQTPLSPVDFTIPGTRKDVDDPTANTASSSDMLLSSTSQALTNLFVPRDSYNSGTLSRRTTHMRNPSSTQRSIGDVSTLGGHLYHVGFKEGRHSDITIIAFGSQYRLHKLLLDRVPFFSSAFSEPWAESSAREMTLEPEDIDTNITKTAFELAIRRIYGTVIADEEEQEAIGLFATACWLDMPDLVESCIDSILRQMQPDLLHVFIKLVTNNCYGKAGDRILSSAKAMLCRDGWEMPYEYWDEIPADVIRDVVGGDPFYVPGEWERWYLTLKLLNRRLRRLALAEGLISPTGLYQAGTPRHLRNTAIRDHLGPRQVSVDPPEETDPWRSLYTHSEIAPLLQLLDSGIHYIHLRFEQLQQLRSQRDVFGVLVLPDKVISDALWMSMELRQKILNAQEADLELNLAELTDHSPEDDMVVAPQLSETKKGKLPEMLPGSMNLRLENTIPAPDVHVPRRFWIPSTDVSCIMGGSSEAYAASSLAMSTERSHRSPGASATFEPSEVAWPPDLGGSIFDSHGPLSRTFMSRSSPRFSRYPPFRFCAEFPNPRTLKEKKRVYSQTVWYAGSMWNLYIQRVNTTKSQQLGIYLHRAKDNEPSGDPLSLTVDDRIGQLEREMLLRKNERRYRHWRTEPISSTAETDPDEDTTDSSGNHHHNNNNNNNSITLPSSVTSPERHSRRNISSSKDTPHKTSQTAPARPAIQPQSQGSSSLSLSQQQQQQQSQGLPSSEPIGIAMTDDDPETELALLQSGSKHAISTIPPYVDARSTINTYFKIYNPSKGGRLLSVYESAPDSFDFGKSWGWRSCQMVLDDGIGETGSQAKDGKLRYMVVLGNV